MTTADAIHREQVLVSPVRRRIVAELSSSAQRAQDAGEGSAAEGNAGALTASELADALGLHVSTVRFHLEQLETAGVLRASSKRRGVGRPRKVFTVVEDLEQVLAANNTRPLMLLGELLVRGTSPSQPRMAPAALGRGWARDNVFATGSAPARTPAEWDDKVASVGEVMAGWGFDTRITTTTGHEATFELFHCPFRELAQVDQEVVCGIHRGVIEGALAQIGEDSTDVRLRPFAARTTCLAHLRPRDVVTDLPSRSAPSAKEFTS